jgi:DNA repair protein RadD
MELRPYQITATECLRGSLRAGNKRPMLYSSTGSGKTEIAMAMVKSAIAKKNRVLFVVNRVELINQTSKRFSRAGIHHGIIQGANTRMVDSSVLVCSIQTLSNRGLPEAEFIIIDEAHYCAGSKTYIAMIEHYKNIPIIGLSATPFSKGLGKQYEWGRLFDDLVIATTIRKLIEDGFLVDADIYAPSKPDLSNVRTTGGDYNDKDLGEACDKAPLIGSIVDTWKKYGNNKPTVCFAVNISHSKHIVEQFRSSGIEAEHIDCYADEDERKNVLDRVLSGQTKIICNVGILTTGWDFPACEVMIMARPTKSLILWVQMAGRILRPFPGKLISKILDHSGTAERLGFPTDDLPLFLCDGKPKLSSASTKEKEEKLPKVCPSCSYVKKSGGKCPICGFAPVAPNTVESAAGELVKMTKRDKAKAAKIAGYDKQNFYSELLHMAADKGYSSGWVSHKYKSIFGVWPRGLIECKRIPSLELKNLVTHQNIKFGKAR